MFRKFQKVLFLLTAAARHRKTVQKLQTLAFGKSILLAIADVKKKNVKDIAILNALASYRVELLQNKTQIHYDVFEKGLKREVSEICNSAASPKSWAHFFYFLIKYSGSLSVIEIGTNLGVSGQYFLSALTQNAMKTQKKVDFVTIEGVEGLCDIANKRFMELNPNQLVNVKVHNALYDDILPEIVAEKNHFDIVFIDGNHRYSPTLKYYEMLLDCVNEKAIFIFDDINWNAEMQEAWKAILHKNYHSYAIDFYKLGIVVIDKTEVKKNQNESFKMFLKF